MKYQNIRNSILIKQNLKQPTVFKSLLKYMFFYNNIVLLFELDGWNV